jgi:hypothetical protein
VAIVFAVVGLDMLTTIELAPGVLVEPATVTVRQPVQFPAVSLTRIFTDAADDFRTPIDDTDSDKSAKGIETLVA